MKALKILLALGAFASAALLVPRVIHDLQIAATAFTYGKITGTIAIISLLAAFGLGLLRSAFTADLDPDRPSGSGGFILLILLLTAGVGAALYVRHHQPVPPVLAETQIIARGSQTLQPTRAAISETKPPLKSGYASLGDAQKDAVRLYPAIGREGSPENRAYLARYKQYQSERPEFFQGTDWPVRLAAEVADKPTR